MAEKSSFEKANARRYMLEAGFASVVYVLATMGSAFLVRRMEEGDPLRIAAAMIPVIAALGLMVAVIRFVVRSDELEQLVHMKGAMLGAVAMIMFCITYGFLQSFAGFPSVNAIWIAMVGILVWSLAGCLLKLQYR